MSDKLNWIDSESYDVDPFQAFFDFEFNHSETNTKCANRQSFETAWKHQQQKIEKLKKELLVVTNRCNNVKYDLLNECNKKILEFEEENKKLKETINRLNNVIDIISKR